MLATPLEGLEEKANKQCGGGQQKPGGVCFPEKLWSFQTAVTSVGVCGRHVWRLVPCWSRNDEVILCQAAFSCALLWGLISHTEGEEGCSMGLEFRS